MIYLVCFFLSFFFLWIAERLLYSEEKQSYLKLKNSGLLGKIFNFKERPSHIVPLYRKIAIVCVCVGLFLPSILSGLRDYSIGTDILLYGNRWFYIAGNTNFLVYLKWATSSDIGALYALINYVIAAITNNPHAFYFFLTLIEVSIVFLSLLQFRKEISVSFAMLVYYMMFYNISLNILRQSLAISLMIAAYICLCKKGVKAFLIVWLLACMAHASAIVMIIILPLKWYSNKSNSEFKSFLLMSVMIMAVVLYAPLLSFLIRVGFLSARFQNYTLTSQGGGRVIRTAFIIIIMMIIVVSYASLKKYDKNSILFINLSIISFVMTMLLFVGNNQVIRIAYYFDLALIIVFPFLQRAAEAHYLEISSRIVKPFLIVLLIGYWTFNVVIQNNGETYPYQYSLS